MFRDSASSNTIKQYVRAAKIYFKSNDLWVEDQTHAHWLWCTLINTFIFIYFILDIILSLEYFIHSEIHFYIIEMKVTEGSMQALYSFVVGLAYFGQFLIGYNCFGQELIGSKADWLRSFDYKSSVLQKNFYFTKIQQKKFNELVMSLNVFIGFKLLIFYFGKVLTF